MGKEGDTVNSPLGNIVMLPKERTMMRRIWMDMIRRCESHDHPSYFRYGGRGITVCERWHDFEAWLADVGRRPSLQHSMDRYPNNDGPYCLDNFRWATSAEQHENQVFSYYVLHEGKPLTIRQFTALTKMLTPAVFEGFKTGALIECCKDGHPFSPDNIYFYKRPRSPGKHRSCRTCRYLANKRAYLKLREEIGLPPPRPSKLVRPPKYLKCPHPAMRAAS